MLQILYLDDCSLQLLKWVILVLQIRYQTLRLLLAPMKVVDVSN